MPNRFFIASVKKKALARAKPRPIHAVFHSQSFRLHTSRFGVSLGTVGPGTKTRHTRAIIMAGAIQDTSTNVAVETFSFTTYGKEMVGSVRENGRWFGEILVNAAPTTIMRLF